MRPGSHPGVLESSKRTQLSGERLLVNRAQKAGFFYCTQTERLIFDSLTLSSHHDGIIQADSGGGS
jgi:hypothetical protein